jgi:hypothetical protein
MQECFGSDWTPQQAMAFIYACIGIPCWSLSYGSRPLAEADTKRTLEKDTSALCRRLAGGAAEGMNYEDEEDEEAEEDEETL